LLVSLRDRYVIFFTQIVRGGDREMYVAIVIVHP